MYLELAFSSSSDTSTRSLYVQILHNIYNLFNEIVLFIYYIRKIGVPGEKPSKKGEINLPCQFHMY